MGNCVTKNSPRNTHNKSPNRSVLKRSESIRKKPNFSVQIFDNEECKTAEILEVAKKSRDVDVITTYLKSHFLFKSLPDEVLSLLTEELKLYKLQKNSLIFEQGTFGRHFFMIKRGKVEILSDGTVIEILEKGSGFGEIALLQELKRKTSARCTESTELWGITREKFKVAVKAQISKTYSEYKDFLMQVPMFKILSAKQINDLISVLTLHVFNQYEIIINEGDPGDMMYFIKKGEVSVTVKGEELRKLSEGEYIGEQALLYDTKRTATVTALDRVELLGLGRESLVHILGDHLETIIYKNSLRIAFEASERLKFLNEAQVNRIISIMKINKFERAEVVIEKTCEKGKSIWIVLQGCLTGEGKHKVFKCIGDNELGKSDAGVFKEAISAVETSVVGEISYEQMFAVIGEDLETALQKNKLLQVLKKVPLLKLLPDSKLVSILSLFKSCHFNKGETIFKINDLGDTFYIVETGKVKIVKGDVELRVIGNNDFFGERAILNNEKRTATVIAKANTKCWGLSRDDFLSLIDTNFQIFLLKRMTLQNDSLTLAELSLLYLIGKGQFGSVFLCTDKKKVEYALKTVSRGIISHYDLAENLMLERKILLQLDHPMIVKLVKTFKDKFRVGLLMEYVKGQDLFDVLRTLNILKESDSLFYTVCLVLIVEYLHSLKIVYRDLKPENVMIDYDGYPKLVDFGISKIIENRTYTTIGTPHYMAPEVVSGKGYTFSIDYWSMGVMIYEFLYCNVPFGSKEEDPFHIYQKVIERKLVWPEKGSVPKANTLIDQLLSINPSQRGTIESIKKSKWFKGVCWDNFMSKSVRPPYLPKCKVFKKSDINSKPIEAFLARYEASGKFGSESMPDSAWDFEF